MLTVHARAWVSFFFLLLFSFFFFHYYYCYNYYGFISISMYNHIGFFFYSMQVVTGTYIYICIPAIYTRAQSHYFFPLADIREPEYCVILRVSSRRIAFYCYCYFTLVEWLLLVSFFFFCSFVLFFAYILLLLLLFFFYYLRSDADILLRLPSANLADNNKDNKKNYEFRINFAQPWPWSFSLNSSGSGQLIAMCEA